MDVLNELWLHGVCGFEPEKVEKIAAVLGERGKHRFSSETRDIRALKEAGMGEDFAKRISDPVFLDEACELKEYCRKNRIRIITWDSAEYPVLLKHIKTPPRILFVKGQELDLNSNLFVSVVGSRISTDQGRNAARNLGYSMAENGIVVASGMAEGIDAEAHKGALQAGGKTVAVLAGSVDTIYPLSNKKLYFEILENGAVISERPPGTMVKPYFYQQRNRIVVGLSRGTVVVEGKIKSGTAISARLALENNRDVFGVPGNPMVWQSELPNSLIADGAMIVDHIEKPAEFYKSTQPDFFADGKLVKTEQNTIMEGLSEEELKIINFINECGGVSDYEAVASACRIAPGVLGARLVGLCIRGILGQESGNRYVLLKKC